LVRKPAALEQGATLGIISPASPAHDLEHLSAGITVVEKLGFKVSLSKNVLGYNKYLAGTEKERLEDLHRAFLDPAIKGIICLRGGYGSMRLLSGINYRIVRRNPKIFIGYSDITALQLALWKKTGLVTFSGPMLTADLGNEPSALTLKHFYNALTERHPVGAIPCAPNAQKTVLAPGRARGRLLGGNLTMVAATLGTPYEIDTRGAILFLEDIDEQPYRVDRMLQQLHLAGKLDRSAGIVFGEFVNCEADDKNSSLTLLEVIQAAVANLGVPSFYGLCAGHGAHKVTLPLGVQAEINADECLLEIIEPATI